MNFNSENKFFTIMLNIGNIIYLNILFILFSLPIITVGASTCALYSVIRKIFKNEESYITKDFISDFKINFKGATTIWMIVFVSLVPLVLFSYFFVQNFNNFVIVVMYVFTIICFLFTTVYLFPIQATFVNNPLTIIRNSLLTSLKHLPYTILLCITTFTPVVITWLAPQYFYVTFIYWLMFGFSIASVSSLIITSHIFKEYM